MTDQKGTDLVASENTNAVATQGNQLSAGDVWQSLTEMAKDPSIDAEKLRALTDIQGTMIAQVNAEKDREAKARFDRAFALACSKMPVITKDAKIEHNGRFIGWFKKYEDIRAIVDEVIRPLGLNVTHDSSEIDGGKGGILVWTVVSYVDSEYTWTEERAKVPVPPDTGGAKGAGQALGSSKTYGERYSLTGTFGIVQQGLDRDGSTPEPRSITPEQEKMIDDGRRAAMGGTKSYLEFWNGRTNVERTWLHQTGEHDKLKKAAAEHD